MSKKLILLISFVLLLYPFTTVWADSVQWDNQNGAGDRLWTTATNWTVEGGGAKHRVPTAADYALLDHAYTDDADGPIIQAGMNAVCNWLAYGYNAAPPVEAVLTMTGGTLTVTPYGLDMGWSYSGNYRFDISGGDVNLAADLTVGDWGSSTIAVVNMSGGTITVGEDVEVGAQTDMGHGFFNMSGGTINMINEQQLYIGFYSTSPSIFNITGGTANVYELSIGNTDGDLPNGVGLLKLHGGTINAEDFSMGGGGNSSVDITSGVLIVTTDVTMPNGYLFNPGVDSHANAGSWTGTVSILVDKGLITAYDINSGDIITDDVNYPAEAGLRAVVNVDYGVTNAGKTTISASAVDPNMAWNPTPANGAGGLIPSAVTEISWSAGASATAHDVYFGTDFDDVNTADTTDTTGIYKGTQPLADVNYPVSVIWGKSYYWRIDEKGSTWKGIVWSFATSPAWATEPIPQDGAEDVSPSVVLSWTPGPEAVTHRVYLSTDYDDVNDRLVTPATPGPNSYTPTGLEFSTTYYWAVDEVNLAADINVWPSEVWSFTTADHLVVDDFEGYLNHDAMKAAWNDYWYGPGHTNHGYVFKNTDADFSRDGNSMKFTYENATKHSGVYYGSWATGLVSKLGVGNDWTVGGSKALVLYFIGQPTNSKTVNDRMYLQITDGAATPHTGTLLLPDMNDVQETTLHEWNISLADPAFSSVVKTNIASIRIGFGGTAITQKAPGGKGTMYFDDVQIWPPRCRPDLAAVSDLDDDCTTDMNDLDILAADWLVHDYNFIATAPNDANLIGWWKFDEGSGTVTVDSSIYDNDGNIFEAAWTTGYPGDPCDSALKFDGDGVVSHDLVRCAERVGESPGTYPPELIPETFTISCWTKLDRFVWFSSFVTNGIDSGDDECGFFLYNWGWEGDSGQDFGLAIRTETGMAYVETPNIYETKRWYHLSATYDGNYVNIYVDGLLAEGPADVGGPMRWISADSNNYPGNFVIGSWEDVDYSLHVNGTIDEVRYYNYALSNREIPILAGTYTPGQNVYQPVPSIANITDPEPQLSRKVNFFDFAVMANNWLVGPVLWP